MRSLFRPEFSHVQPPFIHPMRLLLLVVLGGILLSCAVLAQDEDAAMTQPKGKDEIQYLKASELFRREDLENALKAATKLTEDFPESDWHYKSLYLQSQALVGLKRFQEAEAIYREEANRLLSDSRKKRIAGVLIDFADRLATPPDPNDLEAPQPDYAKAHSLYAKALEMEIARDLRDDVLFKKAKAILDAGNPSQAIQECKAYLAEYDPKDQDKEVPASPGKHVLQARYHLAVALANAGQRPQCRWEAGDLLKRLNVNAPEEDPLYADARWLLVSSFQMPNPPEEELDRGVQAARSFLKEHPSDPRAVKAAYSIAKAYETHGRHDQAVDAYKSFVAEEGYEPSKENSEAELWKQEALFRMAEIRLAQKQYDEAIRLWQECANRYPNGRYWSQSQSRILDAEFQKGIQCLEDEDYEKACSLFEGFLKRNPLDARSWQILFLFGQIHFAKGEELEEADADSSAIGKAYEKAIDEWSRLASKHPNTQEASLALLRVATTYEEKLGNPTQALETYRQVTGARAGRARQRIAAMTEKSLTLATARKFRTDEPPVVHLKTRNIEKVTVRVYRLDMEEYFRKTHATGGVEKLDVSLIEPDETWELEIETYAKHKPLEQDLEIPFPDGQPGAAVVNVSEEDWEATTLVLRSDLDLIFKASRRQVLAFVVDRLREAPAEEVKILLSDGEGIIHTGKTGPDGVFIGEVEPLRDMNRVGILAVSKGHIASHNLDLMGLQSSSGLTPRGFIYTDRPAYRPGEKVSFRGILRDVTTGSYSIPTEVFTISITDAQGRLLREEEQTLSSFGTFAGELALPEGSALGEYVVRARVEGEGNSPLDFTGRFEVQQFKLEKIRLSMDLPRDVYFRGEIVEGKISASTYWGEALSNAQLRYELPDGRAYDVRTDGNGEFVFTFDTSAMRPGRWLDFSAALTGKNVAIQHRSFLAVLGFSVDLSPSQPVVLAGEPVDLRVKTMGADGKPVGREIVITVLRAVPPKDNPVLDGVPWLSRERKIAETTVKEMKVSTGADTGESSVSLQLDEGGTYTIRASGKDRFDRAVTGDTYLRVSDEEDNVRLRVFSSSSELQVGKGGKVRLHSRMEPTLALLTYEGEEILRHEVLRLKRGYTPVSFQVGHDLFPNFRLSVAAMEARSLRAAAKDFTVMRQLQVTVRTVKEQANPGSQGQAEITATDQLGNPVKAEFSLALVKEALFAAYPDKTPPVLTFFQENAKRHAEFRMGATCDFEYAGVARRVIKEVLDEEERLSRIQEKPVQILGQPQAEQALTQSAGIPTWSINANGDLLGRAMDEIQTLGKIQQVANDVAPYHESTSRALGQSTIRNLSRLKGLGAIDGSGVARGGQTLLQGEDGQGYGYRSEDAPAGPSPPPPPRREMAGAGFWLPSAVTNDEGKALIDFSFPETATEWRLTARGCTSETLVGEATAQTITGMDFFLEVKVPSLVREGDEVRILAKAHNLTDYEGPVRFELKVGGEDVSAGSVATNDAELQIAPHSVQTAVFGGFKVPSTDCLAVQVSARQGKRGDAVKITVPVIPWGMEVMDHEGGIARTDATALLALEDLEYSWRRLVVSVAPTVEEALLDMAETSVSSLSIGLPSGTRVGNTGSDLLAVMSALSHANRGSGTGQRAASLLAKARQLTAHLISSQRENGGWCWHSVPGQVSDWPTTCSSYWALVAARDGGVALHPDTLNKSTQYLQECFRTLTANDLEGRALLLHALSLNGEADFANLNRLYRERNDLGNGSLALTGLAFSNMGRTETAGELAGILASRMKTKQDGTGYWEHGVTHPYLQDDVETTALSLLLLARVEGHHEEAAKAAKTLMKTRGCFGWNPAKATGPSLAALSAWHGQSQDARSDYRVTILVNDRKVGVVKSAEKQGPVLLEIPEEKLIKGENRVSFQMDGRGEYAYSVTLQGFSPEIKDPQTIRYPRILARHYYHAQLEYEGRPIGATSTSQVRHLENGQRTEVLIDVHEHSYHGYLTLEEPLPAGAMLVEGSVEGDFAAFELKDHALLFYFKPGHHYVRDIRYELVGYSPGKFRVMPTVFRDALRPQLMNLGKASELTILDPGETSEDPYVMNVHELYKLGELHFNDGLLAEALGYLGELYERDNDYNERDLARMLLWIYTSPKHLNPAGIVEMFEILRERYPELEIPFDKILLVGDAYRNIQEFERAWLVFRAAITASFITDSGVSAILEDEGRFLASVDYQENLWSEYPDNADVVASYLALSQALYNKAPTAHQMPEEDGKKPERDEMLWRAVRILKRFLELYPKDPLADDAAFSLANAFLDLKRFPLVVEHSEHFRRRYGDSPMASSFQYMTALGYFWQHQYEGAMKAAAAVAEGTSEDRTFAQYIVGQIYHAQNQPKEAIGWYTKVKEDYPDAARAIAFFEEEDIGMDEVSLFEPGERVAFNLDHRNIEEAFLQVYRVDLMRLYLQEKNLSNITKVHLAGIAPELEKTLDLKSKEKYVQQQTSVTLDLEEEGAYLVICRGDDLFTSGLLLVTPLTIEVQEDGKSGEVRVNVRDTVKDAYREEVHVKIIGTANDKFTSGETDLRGIFSADGVRGEATVIAREGDSHYAFYRGDTWLGPPVEDETASEQVQVAQTDQPVSEKQMGYGFVDYQRNLRAQNASFQKDSLGKFDQTRRTKGKGVQIQATF